MFDIISYIMGHKNGVRDGTGNVEINGNGYEFTDDGEGNITIEEAAING